MYQDLPLRGIPALAETGYIYDNDHRILMEMHADVDRTLVDLDEVSPIMQDAIIAAEDKTFRDNNGVDPVAIARALWADLRQNELVQGGSTITQQYVKNIFTGGEATLDRKLKEAMLAIKLKTQLTNDEILIGYLNTVYFGHGAYGIEAAAQTYFGIPAGRLNANQSALLAGLVAAPSSYDPFVNPKDAAARREYVLGRMVEDGYITQEEADKARGVPVKKMLYEPRERETRQSFPGDYFAWYVRGQLAETYGDEAVTSAGLRVDTTLDMDMQKAAEAAVRANLSSAEDPDAAVVAIDPTNGEILAMYGGRGFADNQFNMATQAKRQPGSAFKPFTLAKAYEAGYDPQDAWYGPQTVTIPSSKCGGEVWQPSNAADGEAGTFTLESATAHSVNTIFAQLVVAPGVGPEGVSRMARRLGINSTLDPVCSITLGTQLVSPLEMTSAYATLAAHGEYHRPTAIRRVRGNVTRQKDWRSEGKQRIDSQYADLVTFAMQGVVTSGTGAAASLGAQPVAGKTGTTQDYKNAWFCGYTPKLVTCVWVGYGGRKETSMTSIPSYSSPVFGGTVPAAIWQDFMADVYELEKWPVEEFPAPDYEGLDLSDPFNSAPAPPPASETPSPTRSPGPGRIDDVDEEPSPVEEPSDGPGPNQ